jgi:branched-chain amino acid transport system permease protein
MMASERTRRGVTAIVLVVLLGLVPWAATAMGEPFYVKLFARMMIFAIAALSLDLILGFGGMVSFGHAAYLGVGAYAVGICISYELESGWLHLPVVLIASAAVATVIGTLCLRTTGVYFIMITLAFSQMLYFLGVSLKQFGGDDGMTLNATSTFFGSELGRGRPPLTLYYAVLALLALCLAFGHQLVDSRFGRVLRGIKSNERRMRAIGFDTDRYKLVAFVIAGTACGLAGGLLANLEQYVSPSQMHWTHSGKLMVMVILGGMQSLVGPVIGTIAFLMLEEWLSSLTQHWMIIMGPMLLALVLFARRGLYGVIAGRSKADG